MSENCPLCQPQPADFIIHEFPYSLLMFGKHQFYPGYAVLVAKNHARELHRLPQDIRDGLWQELMLSGSAIDKVFSPWKLNYASYGNQVEHIHWHIFPRYTDDPNHKDCPFMNSEKFAEYPTDPRQLNLKKQQIKKLIM